MGRILDFHKKNCFAILVQSFFVLAFIGGYIAFLTTFLNQNRDQVPTSPSSSLVFPLLQLPPLGLKPGDASGVQHVVTS